MIDYNSVSNFEVPVFLCFAAGAEPIAAFDDGDEAEAWANESAARVVAIDLAKESEEWARVKVERLIALTALSAYSRAQERVASLREQLPAMVNRAQMAEASISEIARAAGITRQTVYNLLGR